MTVQPIYDRPDWPAVLVGESLLFGLLGKMLYTYPEREWLEPLVEPDFFDESPLASDQADFQEGLVLLQSWNRAQNGRLTADSLDELRADYTRLFIGPGKVLAPPWESVHFSQERLTFQQQTVQVREWYRRYGVEAANLYHEPDDHVGLEIAFLAHLANLALAAAEDRGERFAELLAAQREFLHRHPLRWAGVWQEQVASHAQTPFYRGAARLAWGALQELDTLLPAALVSGNGPGEMS
jgi:putative dimethyl sulfoxide reductase chaperone